MSEDNKWMEDLFDKLPMWIQIPIAFISGLIAIVFLGLGLYAMIMHG